MAQINIPICPEIDGEKMETVTDIIFLGSKKCREWLHYEIKRCLFLGKKAMTNLDSILKKQRHHLASKGPYSQSYHFSSSHVQMWELDHKEGWALKNWCFHTVVLEKTLESPLDCKEIQPVHPKGNQPWIFIGVNLLSIKGNRGCHHTPCHLGIRIILS